MDPGLNRKCSTQKEVGKKFKGRLLGSGLELLEC